MTHLHRFFVPPDTPSRGEISLPPEETHHGLHVVRIGPGDLIQLFDGTGRVWDGQVSGTGRHEVRIELLKEEQSARHGRPLTLVQAWLHQDRATERLVRRCTELGVGRFIFFRGARSERAPKLSDKWRRWAVESCKQCGNNFLPTFDVAGDLGAAMELVEGPVLVATTGRKPTPLSEAVVGKDGLALLVGPEGDFSEEELELALDGEAVAVSLGPTRFRSEVAATVLATLVLYEWGRLGPDSEEI